MRISDWSSDVCSSDLIFVGFLRGHFQRADDVAADLRIGVAHLFHEARRADHQLVGQEDGERLAAHALAREPDGMADRKSVAKGTSVSGRGDTGGRRIIKTRKKIL